MKLIHSTLLIVPLLWLAHAAYADESVPAHVFSRGVDKNTAMLVDKEAGIAHFVQLQNDKPVSVKSYTDLLFGENDGPKEHEGDKRTPEGVYRVTHFLPDMDLDARYGAGAFPLNYPNPIDRIEGRDGSGIWLHGRDDNDLTKEVTRGCVAFTNKDIVELQPLLAKSTDVVLAPQVDFVSPDEYRAERKRLLKVLDDFIEAWQKGDFDTMENALHPDFTTASGQSGEAWLGRKKWIHKATPQRLIGTDKVNVIKESNDQVVYEFEQSYCAKNISTRGIKRLFFKQDDSNLLKLMTERFTPLKPAQADKKGVLKFINIWLKAWNDGDLETYISKYDSQFRDSRKRNLSAYRAYKQGIFTERPDQTIEVRNLEINAISGSKFRVKFDQKYTSKAYSDVGRKQLIVNACAEQMTIEQETWSKL